MIGVAIAAALAIAVTLVLVLTNGSHGAGGDTPTTSSSTTGSTRTSSSQSVPTKATVPVIPATCESSPVDSYGMTPCLQAVAGPNAVRALICGVATDNPDMKTVLGSVTPVASSVCAGLYDGRVDVIYVQFSNADDAVSAIDALASRLTLGEKSWRSGGGSGRYVIFDADGGPQLYWSYSGMPVIALATSDASGNNAGKPPLSQTDLTTFWQNSLLPQAAS